MLTGSSAEVEIMVRQSQSLEHGFRGGAQTRTVAATVLLRSAKSNMLANERLGVALIRAPTHKWWLLSASADIVVGRKVLDYEKRQTVDRSLPNLQLVWREIQRRDFSEK